MFKKIIKKTLLIFFPFYNAIKLFFTLNIFLESSADVLNVFDYNKNSGELILTKQVPTIFDGAESIQLDWLTGKIYWITHNDRRQYSIKVTDQSFERAEYVVENFAQEIYEMKIYPQRR